MVAKQIEIFISLYVNTMHIVCSIGSIFFSNWKDEIFLFFIFVRFVALWISSFTLHNFLFISFSHATLYFLSLLAPVRYPDSISYASIHKGLIQGLHHALPQLLHL